MAESGDDIPDERALSHIGLGDVHAALGDHGQAAEHWRRALAIYRRLGMPQADAVAAKLAVSPPSTDGASQDCAPPSCG
ncbi:hypothetical protein C8D88_1011839 [Lentzea atacamensis]|uniref:Tetratricopeptide repeat-containing protein n=2 Tax=Lentzea atacamensis TaxID=531938 RepID=A0A316IGB8_9PSEU|nr:hypothetical protein C8D88_1011839 [Lentzea atacamensis]